MIQLGKLAERSKAPVSKAGGCNSLASSNLALSSNGRVAEWIKAPCWKRGGVAKATPEGSNPSSTAGDTMSRSKHTKHKKYSKRALQTPLAFKTNECDDSKVLKKMQHAIHKKATWGQTLRIRNRNAQLWHRLLGKARRRADDVVIETQLEDVEERT